MDINESTIIEDINEEYALACLLVAGVLFLNNTNVSWDETPRYTTCVYVNCNDTFSWGSADAECIVNSDGEEPSEMIELYKLWKDNNKWGSTKWVCIKRQLQPQEPVKKAMIAEGAWNDVMENLSKNRYF